MGSNKLVLGVIFGLLILGIGSYSFNDAFAAIDSKGKEFIITFNPNNGNRANNVQLHITSDVSTTATINYPVNSPTFTDTVNVSPGVITVVDLPLSAQGAWTPGIVQNNAVLVQSPQEVTVYTTNLLSATSDAGLAIPTDANSFKYIAAAWSSYNTELTIAATKDNTKVTIVPTIGLQGGFPANVPFEISLNRGEGFFGKASSDLSGTIITADKPISMTNGNQCTQIPPGGACDHIYEHAIPVQGWGKSGLVGPLPSRSGSQYHVTASENNTAVSLDGSVVANIGEGEFYNVGLLGGVHEISADKPIFINQFLTGGGSTTGDPAMANIIPPEQFLNQYTFSTTGGATFVKHFLGVTVANSDINSFKLDGVTVDSSIFTPIGSSGFSYGLIDPISEGTHTTSSPNGHGILVGGFGYYDSYLYPGGAAFEFINPQPEDDRDGDGVFDVNDACPDEFGTLPNGCPESEITMMNCTYDDETNVNYQEGFDFEVGGSCDVYRGDNVDNVNMTLNVVKEIPDFALPSIGDAPNTLSINGKHDVPGPMKFRIQAWNVTSDVLTNDKMVLDEEVTWPNDDNTYETIVLDSKLPGDAITLRFTFLEDRYDCNDNSENFSDCDRNGHIDYFVIDNKKVEAENYDQLGNDRSSNNACLDSDEGEIVCPWQDGYMQYDLNRIRAEPTCYEQTGTFTMDFGDGLGIVTVTEQGEICDVNNDGSELSLSGDVTSATNSEELPQCGSVFTDIILNNDSTQNSSLTLNQCQAPEPKKTNNGGDNQWNTRPTFGISHEDLATQVVDSGFSFNGEFFTLTDNHHTDFAEQSVEIGTTNSFSAKVYADKKLKVQEFLFGIPEVGKAELAELGVEVWYDRDGSIEDVKVVQKSDVIDASTLSVIHEKTKCLPTDSEPLCDTTTVSMTFLEPLADKVMAIKAIDYALRDQRTFLNEGFDISGDSLNPMSSKMIPSNVRDQGLLKVTQLAKYSPYWQSDDGRMFEMNSFGSFKEINQSFKRHADTGDARTRLHSEFGGIIQYEQNRALGIFDANQYKSELPESFAYIYPESGERITDKLLQEMLLQEEIAKGILAEMDKQNRYN